MMELSLNVKCLIVLLKLKTFTDMICKMVTQLFIVINHSNHVISVQMLGTVMKLLPSPKKSSLTMIPTMMVNSILEMKSIHNIIICSCNTVTKMKTKPSVKPNYSTVS